jgi:hypothetical protein
MATQHRISARRLRYARTIHPRSASGAPLLLDVVVPGRGCGVNRRVVT